MKNIAELRERRNAKVAEARALNDNTAASGWNADVKAKYDAIIDEVDQISDEIKREEQLIALAAETNLRDIGIREKQGGAENANRLQLQAWLRNGDNAFTAEQWAKIRATMSTTTPSEGGYTVQSDIAAELIAAEKAYGGMRESSTTFATSKGSPMSWPTCDDTGNTGELIAENTTANDLDLAFGTVAMNVYKFSSKIVTVPIELLQDSEIDIDRIVLQMLAIRLGRVTNTYFTTGTGTNQPRGIVTAAASGKVGTTGQTLTVTYDDLIDLEHSVDPAYRNAPGVGFMMNDSSIKVIRKIKDSEGRPIFVPGYETGVPGGAPATLLGRPLRTNQDIAVMAANAKSILFGDLKNYRIRDVMAAEFFRFTDSAFAKKGQVGFLAWQRAGGNLLDVSGATVKYYQNSAI